MSANQIRQLALLNKILIQSTLLYEQIHLVEICKISKLQYFAKFAFQVFLIFLDILLYLR